jgi:hypothetical protein
MHNRNAFISKRLPDEFAAMTLMRLALAAQHAHVQASVVSVL